MISPGEVSYWGEVKDNNVEGYGTGKWADGSRYKGQHKKRKTHGYGISLGSKGDVHYGEYKKNKRDGHGYLRFSSDNEYIGNEYIGKWKYSKTRGEGICKESDLIFRVKYDQGYLSSDDKINVASSK